MTYKIKATRLQQEFGITPEVYGELVRYHAAQLSAWNDHMMQVSATVNLPQNIPDPASYRLDEEGKPTFDKIVFTPEKYMPYPPPVAPACVQDALSAETFKPDFEVEDDRPTADEILAERKRTLIHDVTMADIAAQDKVIAPGKRRLVYLQYADALAKVTMEDGKVQDARSEKEKALCADYDAKVARMAKLDLHAATMCSDIEDLTSETIDDWKMTPFPEV